MNKEESKPVTQEITEQSNETAVESPENSQEVISEIVTENDPNLKIQEYTINFQRQVDDFRLAQLQLNDESEKNSLKNEPMQDVIPSQMVPSHVGGLRQLKRKVSQFLRRVEHAEQINDFIQYFESQAYHRERIFSKPVKYTDELPEHTDEPLEYAESYEPPVYKESPQVLSSKEIRIIESWFKKSIISPLDFFHDLEVARCNWRELSIESLYDEGAKVSYVDMLLTEPDLYQAFKAMSQIGAFRGGSIDDVRSFVSTAEDLKSQNLLEYISNPKMIETLQELLGDSWQSSLPRVEGFKTLFEVIQDSRKVEILKTLKPSSLGELSEIAQGLIVMESEFPEDIELLVTLVTEYRVNLDINYLRWDDYRLKLHGVLENPSVLQMLKDGQSLEVANQLADFMHESKRDLNTLPELAVLEGVLAEKSQELPIVCALLQESGIVLESQEPQEFQHSRQLSTLERLSIVHTTLQTIESSGMTVAEAVSPDRIAFLKRAIQEMPDLFSVTNRKVWSLLAYEGIGQVEVTSINFDTVRLARELFGKNDHMQSSWIDQSLDFNAIDVKYWKLMSSSSLQECLVKLNTHLRPEHKRSFVYSTDSADRCVDYLESIANSSVYQSEELWQWYEQLIQTFGENIIDPSGFYQLKGFIDEKALHPGVMPIIENISTQFFFGERRFDHNNFTSLLQLFKRVDSLEVEHYLGLYVPLRDKLLGNIDFITNFEDFKFLAEHEILPLIDQNNDTYVIRNIIAEKEFIASLPREKRQFAVPLIEEMHKSASPEIIRLKDIILKAVLEQDDPLLTYADIEKIFLQNNLPEFGKHFLVFEQLYTNKTETNEYGKKLSKLDQYTQTAHVSPMLRASGELRQRSILYADVLKINIDSNNDSLKKFLTVIKNGQYLIDRINESGVDSLSSEEQSQLSNMLEKVQRVNSAHSTRGELDVSSNLEEAIGGINETLGVKSGQSIASRLVEKYARPLGYTSIEQILERMENANIEASERNLQGDYIRDGKLAIKPGDLVKAVPSEYWNNINQEGLVAREFLGGDANSDRTPFDTDLFRVLEGDSMEDVYEESYGDVCVVVRDRGQFIETTNSGHDNWRADTATPRNRQLARNQEARNKYELFVTGVIDKERHVGIRTGLAATEIDALVISKKLELDSNSTFKKESIYFDIANNGFYIPVANFEGDVVFNLDDYDTYRLQSELIDSSLEAEEFSPENLLAALKKNPYLQLLYESSAGVGEGYSLEQHTQMVMNQFEKYFSKNKDWSGLSLSEFRLLLALHDIGKPAAFAINEGTSEQHEYTRKVMRSSLKSLGTDVQRAERLLFIMDQDVLGEYFKGLPFEKAVKQIKLLSDTTQIEPSRLLEILRIFYISDAGSYTEDAGGTKSLDDIFDFTNTDSHGFAGEYLAKYRKLEEYFSGIDVSS